MGLSGTVERVYGEVPPQQSLPLDATKTLPPPPQETAPIVRIVISDTTLAWLAGLLEGEGCFQYKQTHPEIFLGMTDLDVVQRVAKIWGKAVAGPYVYKKNVRPVYHATVAGLSAIAWMERLLPLMGQRRRSKIESILAMWAVKPNKRYRRQKGLKNTCHPELEHFARGLCQACYRRLRNAERANLKRSVGATREKS